MVRTCPGCANRVLVRADHSCPACGEDTRKEPQQQRVVLRHLEPLPPVCVGCLSATAGTKRLRRVRRSEEDEHGGGDASSFGAFGVPGLLFALLVHLGFYLTRPQVAVTLDIPVCDRCTVPIPDWVEWEAQTLTLTVPNGWAERLRTHRDGGRG